MAHRLVKIIMLAIIIIEILSFKLIYHLKFGSVHAVALLKPKHYRNHYFRDKFYFGNTDGYGSVSLFCIRIIKFLMPMAVKTVIIKNAEVFSIMKFYPLLFEMLQCT